MICRSRLDARSVQRIIVLALVAWTISCAPHLPPTAPPAPQLAIDRSVDADFSALAQTTWNKFLTAFRGRLDCFGNVTLRAAYQLDSRAAYDPQTATVTVRVPGSAAMLESALIHEWAHHVEYQCPAHRALRPAFLVAQGLAPDTPWRPANTPAHASESGWAQIPSEQYAEAAIELVRGRRQIPTTARVTSQAVRVLARWAAGEQDGD